MGVLRRIGDIADRIYNASDLSGVAARLNRRREAPVRALVEFGTPATAVITGLLRSTQADDDHPTDITTLRLEWSTPAGDRVGAAVVTGQGERSPALRLGARIPVRYDDDHVVPVHRTPPGTGIGFVDAIPEPGIEDARGRRKRRPDGDACTAHVESITRRTVPVLGTPADRWDIVLRLPDGSVATAADGAVPAYVHHILAPGLQVAAVADRSDRGRVWIDWHRLAQDHAADAGHVDDESPPGSIAAMLAAADGRPGAPAATAADPAAPPDIVAQVDAAAGESVEGVSLERYAQVQAALQAARVSPADHDEYAAREFGTPLGRWAEIDAEWRRRMITDWRIGAAVGEAIEEARRRR